MRKSALALTGLFLLAAVSSHAAIVWDFDSILSGGTPSGDSPWATLTIETVDTDRVQFTLTHNSTSSAGQFLSELNLNSSILPTSSEIPDTTKFGATPFVYSSNGINAPESQKFDIQVNFGTAGNDGGIHRVRPGESVTWFFMGSGLTENSFNELSFSGSQPDQNVLALIHLQGIPNVPEGQPDSSHIYPGDNPVPEPASLAALGIGALGLLRRRSKK